MSDKQLLTATRLNSDNASCEELSEAIRQRIRRRLGDRVYDLTIEVGPESVTLHGRCATYYTKQLAQHAALGMLDHEQLSNNIQVANL